MDVISGFQQERMAYGMDLNILHQKKFSLKQIQILEMQLERLKELIRRESWSAVEYVSVRDEMEKIKGVLTGGGLWKGGRINLEERSKTYTNDYFMEQFTMVDPKEILIPSGLENQLIKRKMDNDANAKIEKRKHKKPKMGKEELEDKISELSSDNDALKIKIANLQSKFDASQEKTGSTIQNLQKKLLFFNNTATTRQKMAVLKVVRTAVRVVKPTPKFVYVSESLAATPMSYSEVIRGITTPPGSEISETEIDVKLKISGGETPSVTFDWTR